MTDRTWLRNFVSMTQLMQGVSFATNPNIPKNQELILNMQTGLPLVGWSEQRGNVKFENGQIIAAKYIAKGDFVTAYPGDVAVCETKKGPITRGSKRMQACKQSESEPDTPWIMLNATTKVASFFKFTDEPLYCAHLVRNSNQNANCILRAVQSGLQLFLFATKDVNAGEEVVCCQEDNTPSHLCVWCLDPTKKTQFCGKCHFSAYCSKQCQTQHWPQHKHMCC